MISAGAQDQDRQQDGHRGLSDPTGQFEAVLFSEGLAQYPRHAGARRPGADSDGAELQGDEVRARILNRVEPLDAAAAKTRWA